VIDLADRDGATWMLDPETGKPHRSVPRSDHTEIQLCARCHSRRGQLWDEYAHGQPLGNTHRLALLDDHLYFVDGQIKDEVFVYGSYIQSRMYRAGVTCSDCHDAHSGRLHAEGNAVCASCHLPTRYDSESHHHHEPGTAGATCVACHMPERVYMVNDWRADHSLRVPRPDLSVTLGTPNACNGCHADQPPEWAADAVVAWYPDSTLRGAHYAEALHGAGEATAAAAHRLVELARDPEQPGIARATAVDRLQALATAEHLATIETLLNDEDPLIRAAAVRFLELTEVRTRVDLGWPLLDDPQRVVRLEAARVLAPLLGQQMPDRFADVLRQALDEYARSQRVNADRPESHLNLGLVALATGDTEGAEAAYRTALRLSPSFTAAYANLADLYRQQGRDADGEALLRAGIEAAPDSADLPHALGLLLVRQQRLAEALPWLRRATEFGEDQPRYAYVYAIALHGAGRLDAAIEVLQQARQRHPNDRSLRLALADYRRQQAGGR
jgi:tetratricopeptide (TPR) repeat protein